MQLANVSVLSPIAIAMIWIQSCKRVESWEWGVRSYFSPPIWLSGAQPDGSRQYDIPRVRSSSDQVRPTLWYCGESTEDKRVDWLLLTDCDVDVDMTAEIVILNGVAVSGLVVKVQPDKKQPETPTIVSSQHSHLQQNFPRCHSALMTLLGGNLI